MPSTYVLLVSSALVLPNASVTPGATNPDVTPETISKTICNPDWSTRAVRPPREYTDALKRRQLRRGPYASRDRDPRHYEEDHLVPLEAGGASADTRNLWPESRLTYPGASQKDCAENYLHDEICAGRLDLREGQRLIATNWIVLWKRAKEKSYDCRARWRQGSDYEEPQSLRGS